MNAVAAIPDTLPPLIRRLAEHPAGTWVDAGNLEDFISSAGDIVLFLWSSPQRYPEVLDVAVVLPELLAALTPKGAAPRFSIGVVDDTLERKLGIRFGEQRRPALVFLRDGAFVTTVQGMLDWQPFVERVAEALASPTSRAPSIGIAVVAEGGTHGCH